MKVVLKSKMAVMFLIIALIGFIFMTLPGSNASFNPEFADLVIMNGKVITVDKHFSIKEAVAVKDGKIIFVGKNAKIRRFIGPETKTIDLHGKPLLPGINDAHIHMSGFGLEIPPITLDLKYPAIVSIADAVAIAAARITTLTEGQWVKGFGWDAAYLTECLADPNRQPTKEDLDPISPDNPVLFSDFSGHKVWVNSKALDLAEITRDTPDPNGGVIVRYPDGEPTGILLETAAGMVRGIVPAWTRDEQKQGILNALHEINLNGITSWTEPGISPASDTWTILQELCANKQLTARGNIMVILGKNYDTFKAAMDAYKRPVGIDPNWLQYRQIKMIADGVPISGSWTAWLWTPYVGDHGYGSMVIDAPTDEAKYENLLQMIQYGHKKGYQIGVHATGDRAITSVVDGYWLAQTRYHRQWHGDPRHYIIHDEYISDKDIARCARLNVGANMQPYIQRINADSAANVVGPVLGPRDWPFNSVLDAGLNLSFSSDASVTYPDWRKGVQAAVLREGFSGVVNNPDEIITREQAIRAYTMGGAYQDHMEHIKGSIECGKLADFCVIDRDILAVPEHEIGDISVLMTIVDGKIVFEK